MNEERIQKMMKSLECSREEAIEILKEDEAIDGMTVKEAQADLSEEQKKAVKSATKTGSKKRTPVKRERKVDEVKKKLINCIRVLLEGMGAKVKPLETEAEMHFAYENENYTIKLIKHRPPKK